MTALRHRRRAMGYASASEAARQAEVHPNSWWRWEGGDPIRCIETARRVARVLHTTTAEVLRAHRDDA